MKAVRPALLMSTLTNALGTIALGTIALGLWVGNAAAGESNLDDPAADELLLQGNDELATEELSAASGGAAVSQISVSKQDADVEDNPVTMGDGAVWATGSAAGGSANTGGVNVNMVNTGNFVVMQNTTNLNLYLDHGPQ